MNKRKFTTEFGINFVCTHLTLLQQDHLATQIIPNLKNSSIYFICSRPKITIDMKNIKQTENSLSGNFIVHRGDNQYSYPFSMSFPENFKVKLICDYPYTEYKLFVNDHIFSEGLVSNQATLINDDIQNEVPLEVIYIGQSFPHNGRTIKDRLLNHSTLQKIYAENNKETPDNDIYIIIATFEDVILGAIDGKSKVETTEKQNDDHTIMVLEKASEEEQQRTNIIEAALIKYFRPKYNLKFIDKFPDKKHNSYKSYYELDINRVLFEINTEVIKAKIKSAIVAPEWTHFADFPLENKSKKNDLLHFMGLSE